MSIPHSLQLIIDFVNTLDLDTGVDELSGPEALADWLAARGLLAAAAGAGPEHLAAAIELREALRSILAAHNGARAEAGAAAVLDRAADQGQLAVRFASDGSVVLEASAPGVPGALASLLVPVAQAAADGTWSRVKACHAEDCRWAFYDQSRNRSGRWCDMAECGNRHKVRNYRSRRATV